jgi:hypothetical protein
MADTKKLRKGVTLDGMLEHLRAFQNIAIANGDNRAATTPGYDASVAYVTQRLRAAGYRVTHDEFDFPMWEQNGPATVTENSPSQRTFAEGTHYIVSQFSSSGNLTADVVPVDAAPVSEPGTSTSGCEPEDFPAAVEGSIALMMRGTCPFVQKYQMAKDAGAAAALIFNDGFPEREDPLFITSPPEHRDPDDHDQQRHGRVPHRRAGSGQHDHRRERDDHADHRGQRDRGQPARRP